ncbi:MAG: hypothetical protein SGARI_003514 [Bacillariaceae sp.]
MGSPSLRLSTDSPGKVLFLLDDDMTGDSVRQMALGSKRGIRSMWCIPEHVTGARSHLHGHHGLRWQPVMNCVVVSLVAAEFNLRRSCRGVDLSTHELDQFLVSTNEARMGKGPAMGPFHDPLEMPHIDLSAETAVLGLTKELR